MSDSHVVLKSPDLSCDTYLSTPQIVAHAVTSQNNLKNLLHLTGSAEMKKVSKFPTCQSYPRVTLNYYIDIKCPYVNKKNTSYLVSSQNNLLI